MIIRDIRFCESGERGGERYSDSVGKLFAFPVKIHWMGECVARKLRESGFSLGEFDHLYVNFCTWLPQGEWELTAESAEKWYRVCNCGLDAQAFAGLTDGEKYGIAAESVQKILTALRPECKREIESACLAVGWEQPWCDLIYKVTENQFGKAGVILRYYADFRPGTSPTAALSLCEWSADGSLLREREVVSRRELYRVLRHTGRLVLQKKRILLYGKIAGGQPQAETIEWARECGD